MNLRELMSLETELRKCAASLRELGHHDAALRTEEAAEAAAVAKDAQRELGKVWDELCCGGRLSPEERARVDELVGKWREEAPVVTAADGRVDVARRLWELEREAKELRAAVARSMGAQVSEDPVR